MKMEVTVKRVLDRRSKKKKSGKYKLAIRVTHQGTPVPFPLRLEVTEEEFDKLESQGWESI